MCTVHKYVVCMGESSYACVFALYGEVRARVFLFGRRTDTDTDTDTPLTAGYAALFICLEQLRRFYECRNPSNGDRGVYEADNH